MSSVRIRPADRADVATLARVGQQVFMDTYGAISDPDDVEKHVEKYFSKSAIEAEIIKDDVQYFLAMHDKDCAGLLKVRGSDVPDHVSASTALEVQQVYVSSDFQRMGVGELLMNQAVVVAREQGVDGIWLSVWEDAPWATSFYRKYGFESKGEVIFTIGSSDYVDHVMWLPSGD